MTLFGTLHTPTSSRPGAPAVVLLSPGIKMRVGPGRLYVPLTDALNADGYSVLRFDFYGLGDSFGELEERFLPDVYNNIEVGRYVDDALTALEWLREHHGFSAFVLGGLCGGAITAVLTAERDASVVGLLSIGMTVTLASNSATPAKYLTRKEIDMRRRGYYRRLWKPRAWWRFLTLQSEYDVIWRSMTQLVFGANPPPSRAPDLTPVKEAGAEEKGNANPLFPGAFFSLLERGGKALLLFSGNDRQEAEYDEKFAQRYAERLQHYSSQVDRHLVANANHVLSLREWQDEMIGVSLKWMAKFDN